MENNNAEVNNNEKINEMFGTQDAPVVPLSKPALQTSPPENADPSSSPFQEDPTFDLSNNSMFPEDDMPQGDEAVVGDHQSFGFTDIKSRKVSFKLTFVLLPIMLIIGLAGGGFACYVYFFGLDISAERSAATTAIESVLGYVNKNNSAEKVIFADVYVNNKVAELECVVFSVIEVEPTVFRTMSFQVSIDKDTDETMVYSEFNQDEYDRLNSGSDSERIEAQIMLNHKHEFDMILSEIIAKNKNWVNINPLHLNAKM